MRTEPRRDASGRVRRRMAPAALAATTLLLAATAAVGAPTSPPVAVTAKAIWLVKVRQIDQAAGPDDLMTPGLVVSLVLRAAEGQRIAGIGAVEIKRAADDTGYEIPVAGATVRSIALDVEGRETLQQVSSKSVKARKTSKWRGRFRLFRAPWKRKDETHGSVAIASPADATTASLLLFLGLPSPQAKRLRVVEGTAEVRVGPARRVRFRDIRPLVGKSLDLGQANDAGLRLDSVKDGRIALSASGATSRIGRLRFFDKHSKPLEPTLSSRTETIVDGRGKARFSFDLGERPGPIGMELVLYDRIETVEIPILLKNIDLP